MNMTTTAVLMDEPQAVAALAALAQPARLRIFRALVQAGPQGLTPGSIAALLGLAPSTLSFHLKELAHAGLVLAEREGRHLHYRPALARMNALLGWLTEDCCQGQACELRPLGAFWPGDDSPPTTTPSCC